MNFFFQSIIVNCDSLFISIIIAQNFVFIIAENSR